MILYPTFLEEWNSYQSCSKWTIRLYLNCNGTLKDTHLAKLIGCEKKLAQTLPAGFHLHLCFSFIWKMSGYNSFMTSPVKSDWRWNLNATFQIWSNGRGRLFEIHYSLENRLITNSCSSFFRVLLLWWKSVLIQRQEKGVTPNDVGLSSLSSFTTGTLTSSSPFDISSDIIEYLLLGDPNRII